MLIRAIAGAMIGVLPGLLFLILSLLSPIGVPPADDASFSMLPGVILMAIGAYVGALYGASMR